MSRKRRVILIACSLVLVGLLFAVVWLRLNGEFYAMDRSGMELSVGETARHFFSDDPDSGVMYVSMQLPRQRIRPLVDREKALELLRRSSPESELIFWEYLDEVGQVGLFVEKELGAVTIYMRHREYIFSILTGDGDDQEIRYFSENIPFQAVQFQVIPEGWDFSNWEIRKSPSIDSLAYFGRSQPPALGVPVQELAFHGSSVAKGNGVQIDEVLIYFDPAAKAWQVKKWNPKWPLADWKSIVSKADATKQN